MIEALQYDFFRRALAAGLLASVACGVIGAYVVVRRMSSISGGLSHAAFGGVGLGYFFGFAPILGATGFALACGLLLAHAQQKMSRSIDTLISILWAAGMAIGILLIALTPGYAPDLMSYLFGSILFVSTNYLVVILLLDLVVVITVALLFDSFQAVAFDEEFARVLGLPVRRLLQVMLALISLTVVILIQVVGVILVIALLTMPAVVARQWTDRLWSMMAVGAGIAAVCTTSGLFLSYWSSSVLGVQAPTGPLIILVCLLAYGISSVLRRAREPH